MCVCVCRSYIYMQNKKKKKEETKLKKREQMCVYQKHSWGVEEIDEGVQKAQTSKYKVNKLQGWTVQRGDNS